MGAEEHDCPEDRKDLERDRHERVRARVAAEYAAHPQRPPMHAEGREGDCRHVERRSRERVEPSQADEQDHPGQELEEAGHPDPPDSRRDVYAAIAPREPQQLAGTVDQIAGPEAEKTECERDERGWLEADD